MILLTPTKHGFLFATVIFNECSFIITGNVITYNGFAEIIALTIYFNLDTFRN